MRGQALRNGDTLSYRCLIRRHRAAICAAAFTIGITSAHLAHGQVVVQQVEAASTSNSPSYSPFNFNGSSSLSGSQAGFASISTFYAESQTNNTYSAHAAAVAANFYGPSSVGGTAISSVYVEASQLFYPNGQSAGIPFYDDILLLSGLATSPVPTNTLAANNIRVSNHSYVMQFVDDTTNVEAIRASDFLINRDNVVWVGGAVTGTQFVGGNGTTTMAWQPRNAIAVRGDSANTPFTPSLGRPGRQHADLFIEDLASFGCGTVSGYAAALIKQGIVMGSTAAQDQRVIKSVLMSGASITTTGFNFTNSYASGVGLTQNNLDANGGAGLVSYANSLSLLSTGQKAYSAAAGSIAGSSITSGTTPVAGSQGWGFGTITANGNTVILFNVTGAITGLNSTLNWDYNSQTTVVKVGSTVIGTNIMTADTGLIAPDLSLELRSVTWNGTNYSLGSTPTAAVAGNMGLTSNATGATKDNVEHLYLQSGVLAPGTYALLVKGDVSTSVAAALSFSLSTATAPSWNVNADGVFTTGSNWTGQAAPGTVSTIANFGNTITQPRTITVPSAIVLGSLSFSGGSSYTLSTSTGGSLTLSNGALGAANLQVASGTHFISLPVISQGNTTATFAGGSSVTIQSLVNQGTLTTAGSGAVKIAGTLAGNGSLVVGSGTALVLTAAGSSAGHVYVVNQNAATVSGTVAFTSVPSNPTIFSRISALNVLNIPNGGYLDVGNSDLIVHSTNASVLAGYVQTWYAGGARTGSGLGSSLAGTGSGMDQYSTLAVITNVNGMGGTLFPTFDGINATVNDALVKYTYVGDTDLNGVVDGNDLANLLAGMNGKLTGWINGDTNYDGVVNGTDLSNLLGALRHQSGSFGDSGGPGGAIPEPTGLGLLVAATAALRRSRR